ncbi:mucin-associated surface protein (MASP), putative [Trypanosoma cruzi marinkellei]|uniref:Mucin-associated surface protein (MASP), putative n=1 Tax=Trypanosoma cruzi marinkellei TaxID=85056 RepID=K2NL00_TRYCR|nr:mucin-associated surface protein (MASP), putative [Trypanosoma cruzi marinkellei]
MAMMMTGRVLLVCALCVLWCGAAVAVSAADEAGGGDGSAGEYLLLQWRARLQTECAEEVGKRTGGRANASAVGECVRHGMDSLHAVVGGRSRWRRQRPAFAASAATPPAPEGGAKENLITRKDVQTRDKDSPTEKKKETLAASGQPPTVKPTGDEKTLLNPETDTVSSQNGTSDQGQDSGKNAKKQEEKGEEKEDKGEKKITEDTGKKEADEEEDKEGEKEDERNGEEKEEEQKDQEEDKDVDATLEGMLAGGQVKRNSTSGPEGVPNKTNTEGTQAPGNSDSSTAVYHTTSPLSFLLFASAAAAVVAA